MLGGKNLWEDYTLPEKASWSQKHLFAQMFGKSDIPLHINTGGFFSVIYAEHKIMSIYTQRYKKQNSTAFAYF